ncbi:hypothetical protein ATE49_15155 [Elizabethkingia miricola]|uniref:Uncharacterized protein n=1 Tax=Elizabethkingia miricola TaxID=172045 RepID=A0ABY3NAI4_ELIMR|nr:hypothetical protein ATE49_15155 [Elizabethkingia miricola]TYO84204.1 hypothetical protein LX74_04004 [Elizabethkingia miricola]
MFEQQIFTQLKTKYKNLGLGDKVLKVIAKKLSKTVKEESEIENAVEGVEDDLVPLQILSDQVRTLSGKLDAMKKPKSDGSDDGDDEDEEEEEAEGKKPKVTKKTTENKDEEVPAWAKGLISSNEALTKELAGIKAEKVAKSNDAKLLDKLKELGVNEKFYKYHIKGKSFENDEEIEEFANELKESETEFLQENANNDVEANANTVFGGSTKPEEVSAFAKNFVSKKLKPNETDQ